MKTQGFYVSNDSDNGETVIRNNDREIIARMVVGDGYNEETDESSHQTAELFAASADLLSQLKVMVEWLGSEWADTNEVKNSVRLIRILEPKWEPSFTIETE